MNPPDRYFIRYLPDGSEKPYRVYYFLPSGLLRRTRSRGHRTADDAAKNVDRLVATDLARSAHE